jgi:hypothetical protein
MSDPSVLSPTAMFDLTNNKRKRKLCTLVVKEREKKEKIQTIDHRR